jgi:hypothetical protein
MRQNPSDSKPWETLTNNGIGVRCESTHVCSLLGSCAKNPRDLKHAAEA